MILPLRRLSPEAAEFKASLVCFEKTCLNTTSKEANMEVLRPLVTDSNCIVAAEWYLKA